MKKILLGALISSILAVVVVIAGGSNSGAPALVYVYSNSMEPLIQVNDAFIVWPDDQLKVGDIVMFRPVVLKAPYITHRIIGIGQEGYVTKGDNSSYDDQISGEPQVRREQVVGRVLTIGGKPMVFPGLGSLSAGLQSGLEENTRLFPALLLIAGLISALLGSNKFFRQRKSRSRWRLGHIYRAVAVLAVSLAVLSVYLGSSVTQVPYLVSQNPGDLGDQVKVGQPGQLRLQAKNNGFFPVWHLSEGLAPLSVYQAPEILGPFKEGSVVLEVPPHSKTAFYQGYLRVYHYPAFLPRSWILGLHQISPLLPLAAIGITLGLWFGFFIMILNQIPGLEEWVPLKAVRDKINERKLKRAKSKILGRKRVRS